MKSTTKELLGDIILHRVIEKYYVICVKISRHRSYYLPNVLEKCTHTLRIQDLKEKPSIFCIKI